MGPLENGGRSWRVTAMQSTKSTSSVSGVFLRALAHSNWPVAGLILAIIVNAAWVGFLGYWLLKLM
jgi:hypothetical protein